MRISKIILDQFKGINHAEFDFTGNPIIKGANGTGKTTLADAYCWAVIDKDYSLKANPEVHPDYLSESEPSVELICDIDGKTVSLKKIQRDARSKKQREQGAPVRIKNVFEVNTVPVSQSAFTDKLKEYGIDVDKFELLTHPNKFTDKDKLKLEERRSILFSMVTEVSDKEIADSMGDCQEVSTLLDNYTIEEIASMQKQSKKKANEMLDSLPNQILGMEKSKVQIDVSSITADRDALQSEIDEVEQTIKENPLPYMGSLNEKLSICENKKKTLETEANADRLMKLASAKEEYFSLIRKKGNEEYEYKLAISAEEERKARIEALKGAYQSLADSFRKLKAVTFDETSNVCKYCGQPLPKDKADENRKRFTDEIERQKTAINKQAAAIKKQIKELESNPIDIPSGNAIATLSAQIEQKKAEMESFSNPIDVTDTDNYKAIEFEIAKIRQAMDALDFAKKKRAELESEVAEKRRQVNFMNDQISKADVNKHIDEQIAKAKEQQKQYAQASANAEKILDQLSRISMKKNEMLTEQVNSHFDGIKFQLFEQLKNGEFRDTCVPLVPTSDGKYRDITFSANTAAIVKGQLAIISGLQKFYGQNLPVFLDQGEMLDSVSKESIQTDYQLIMLCVSDDKELVIA